MNFVELAARFDASMSMCLSSVLRGIFVVAVVLSERRYRTSKGKWSLLARTTTKSAVRSKLAGEPSRRAQETQSNSANARAQPFPL